MQVRSALRIAALEAETEPREYRALGAFENLFAAYNEEANTTFTLMAELEGEITKVAIERALAAVQARHPLLAVGIRRGADGKRVLVRSAQPIPLKRLPTGAVPWELAAGLEIRRRFDVQAGPLMQASVRFEAKSVRMFFTFHHSIADGMSGAYVIQDFVRALSGERLGAFVEAETLDRRLIRVPLPESAALPPAGKAPDPEAVARWGRGMNMIPAVSARALPRDLTRRVRAVARFHDATVHAALSVALARSMGALRQSSDAVRITSPINIREMLGVGGECGLFIAAGTTALSPRGAAFWDDARGARLALEAFMVGETAHAMIAGMTAFRDQDDSPAGARAGFAAAFNFDAMLTNLGALPIQARHGRLRIKAIAGPIVLASVQDEHIIGAATLEDRLQLTYTSVTPLPGLLERVEQNLVDACKGW